MRVCLQSKIFQKSLMKNLFCPSRLHWRYTGLTNASVSPIKYILVLDFEATCEEINKITQEIIEFPCLKYNVKSCDVEARFHEYVRPVHVPQLPLFCIELTGILQEMVDDADTFPQVLQRFERWRHENDLSDQNSVYVTSGDWDLGRMLPSQCNLSKIQMPEHFRSWIDLKKLYARQTNEMPKSLIEMIRKSRLQFQGRQHSGIDDCLNIANILRVLGKSKPLDLRPTSLLRKSSNYLGFKVMNLDV